MPPKTKTAAKKTTESDSEVELKSVDVVANEVLRGSWGSYDGLRDRLGDAGYNATEILTKVNYRLSRGAPSAYRASAFELAQQVQNGEWGEERGLQRRLESAGLSSVDAMSVLKPSAR